MTLNKVKLIKANITLTAEFSQYGTTKDLKPIILTKDTKDN